MKAFRGGKCRLALLGLCSAAMQVAAQALAPAAPSPAPASAPQRVEVTANLKPDDERRDSSLLMTVLGRDELDADGDTSILDVLQRVPGISIDGDAPRLRGMGGGYTLILINGEPAPPGFTLESLAPADIERIEIIKGPSAEHGGVAGSINVILRRPLPQSQQEFRAQIGHRGADVMGNLAWVAGSRESILGRHLSLSTHSWSGRGEGRTQSFSRDAAAEVRNRVVLRLDEWRGGNLQISPRWDWRFSPQRSLSWQNSFQANTSSTRLQRDTLVLQGPATLSPVEQGGSSGRWQYWSTQLQWNAREDDGRRFEARAGARGSLQRNASQTLGFDLAGVPSSDRASRNQQRQQEAWAGLRWRRPWLERHTLSLGADVRWRRRTELARQFNHGLELSGGTYGLVFEAQAPVLTAYVQDEWQLSPHTVLLSGLRLEQAQIRTRAGEGGAVQQRYAEPMPMLNLRHALDSEGQRVLRMGVSRSIRAPDLSLLMPRYALNGAYDRDTRNTPLAADTAGNPMLRPEQALGLELGFEQQWKPGGSFSVGAFARQIEGLIRRRIGEEAVAEASVPRWVSRPVNLGRAWSAGIEIELKGRADELLPGFMNGQGMRVRAAASLYRSSVEQIDDPDARLEGQPPWSATLGLDQQLPRSIFGWSATLVLTPAFAVQQSDRQRVWRGANQQLDVALRWRFSRQTQFNLALRNALAPVQRSSSSVQDVDGFTARSDSARTGQAHFNLSFTHRM